MERANVAVQRQARDHKHIPLGANAAIQNQEFMNMLLEANVAVQKQDITISSCCWERVSLYICVFTASEAVQRHRITSAYC